MMVNETDQNRIRPKTYLTVNVTSNFSSLGSIDQKFGLSLGFGAEILEVQTELCRTLRQVMALI